MNTPAFILAILGALWLGAMLPGPSFVIVARSAIGQSRLDGLASALGMGIGGILFASLALAGLYSVLQTVGWLYLGLKLAGGAYLLYMSYKIWRGASQPFALPGAVAARSGSARKSFWTGLATQMSNPKTAIWYGSIFAALLPQQPPTWVYFALPPLVFWSSSAGMPSSRCASRPRGRGPSTCARRNGWTGSPPAPWPRWACA